MVKLNQAKLIMDGSSWVKLNQIILIMAKLNQAKINMVIKLGQINYG